MTLNQVSRIKNNKKQKKKISPLGNKPQIKGLTLKIFTMTPKKPNSALRKVAKIKLCHTKYFKNIGKKNIITAYIPGEKHTLSLHNLVLVIPGKTKDLPGIKYKVIRGVLDCK